MPRFESYPYHLAEFYNWKKKKKVMSEYNLEGKPLNLKEPLFHHM